MKIKNRKKKMEKNFLKSKKKIRKGKRKKEENSDELEKD